MSDRSDRTMKERAVGQRDEKVGAYGEALKEKTRRQLGKRRRRRTALCFHFIISNSARRTSDDTPPDKGRDGVCNNDITKD
jgi:hypothetical protein